MPAIRSLSAAVPGAGTVSGKSASSIGLPGAVSSASLGMVSTSQPAGARISPLVGTPVPDVTSTCSTWSTWLYDVPRT